LPDSASVGDTIKFVDYARNWGTNGIVIDSNGLNYQTQDDTYDVEYGTDGTTLAITYMNATQGWVPTIDEAVEDVPSKGNSEGIFGFGTTGSVTGVTNLVSNAGVVATDVAGVGSARERLAACEYGGDKGIFGFGKTASTVSITNLVSNAGVVASDQAATTGTSRRDLAACSYGEDKGIFAFGYIDSSPYHVSISNLVSNAGVVASDTAGVGTARYQPAACEYGGDKAIFGYGVIGYGVSITNLVSNAGVVATDTTGVGTARYSLAACSYGEDKGIFAYGRHPYVSMSNLVSNAGVVATDTTGVGTARGYLGATQYGGDKGIFGFGMGDPWMVTFYSMTNLLSNAGVVATDTAGVGTARSFLAACSFN
jgi:hypothetical protein